MIVVAELYMVLEIPVFLHEICDFECQLASLRAVTVLATLLGLMLSLYLQFC